MCCRILSTGVKSNGEQPQYRLQVSAVIKQRGVQMLINVLEFAAAGAGDPELAAASRPRFTLAHKSPGKQPSCSRQRGPERQAGLSLPTVGRVNPGVDQTQDEQIQRSHHT
jgi:hypothetical protein